MMKLAMHLVLALTLSGLTLSVAQAGPVSPPAPTLNRAATARLYAKDDDGKKDDTKKDDAKKKKSDKGKKEKSGEPAPSGGW